MGTRIVPRERHRESAVTTLVEHWRCHEHSISAMLCRRNVHGRASTLPYRPGSFAAKARSGGLKVKAAVQRATQSKGS